MNIWIRLSICFCWILFEERASKRCWLSIHPRLHAVINHFIAVLIHFSWNPLDGFDAERFEGLLSCEGLSISPSSFHAFSQPLAKLLRSSLLFPQHSKAMASSRQLPNEFPSIIVHANALCNFNSIDLNDDVKGKWLQMIELCLAMSGKLWWTTESYSDGEEKVDWKRMKRGIVKFSASKLTLKSIRFD